MTERTFLRQGYISIEHSTSFMATMASTSEPRMFLFPSRTSATRNSVPFLVHRAMLLRSHFSVQDSPLMSKKRTSVRDHADGSLVWDYQVLKGMGIEDPAYQMEA